VPIESYALRSESIEGRTGVAMISVGPETIRTERVDENEQNVDVVSASERSDVRGTVTSSKLVLEQKQRQSRPEDDQCHTNTGEPTPHVLLDLARGTRL
jgi:hypothetical protein